MPEGTQRLLALGVMVWRDHLLIAPVNLPGDQPAWRCLGGSIELGERAEDAVVREFLEETGRHVKVVQPLPVIENIFKHQDIIGHEAVFPFLLRWAPGHEPDDLSPLDCVEHDGGRFTAKWMPLHEATGGDHLIYPDGFPTWLAEQIDQT